MSLSKIAHSSGFFSAHRFIVHCFSGPFTLAGLTRQTHHPFPFFALAVSTSLQSGTTVLMLVPVRRSEPNTSVHSVSGSPTGRANPPGSSRVVARWLLNGLPERKRKWLSLKAATRVSREQGELNSQAPAVWGAERLVKVSTVFFTVWSRPQKLSTLRQ
jgi:hypothetical protein